MSANSLFKGTLASALFLLSFAPQASYAQGAAPGMFSVGEIVVNFAQFDDPKASDTCNLSREKIATVLKSAFTGTTVPAVPVSEAKPPLMGVARIALTPEISTYAGENLDCVSWISLSAENRVNAVIPPVETPRSITAVYWRQQTKVVTGQSMHAEKIADVLRKMAQQFTQQYRLDQPSLEK